MIKISGKLAAKKLEEALKNVTVRLEAELDNAVKDLAHSAFATIQAKAQRDLNSTRQDYLKNLNFEKIGSNSYIITLEGDWANALEEGFAPFNLSEKMLQSKKNVSVGARAGQPWVQESKKGNKYAHVPLSPKRPKGATMADALRDVRATNLKGRKQKITSIFKDPEGKPIQGKVATAGGITKYQRTTVGPSGRDRTESIYIAYRTVSEAGKTWFHPGYAGLSAFEEAEKQIVKNIDQIIKAVT